MAPFQHLLHDSLNGTDELAIITYLSERTHIHLVPYTKQFMLIGVSYDRVPPAASIFEGREFLGKKLYGFELMAIPHEVGHYIYNHGKLDGQTLPALSEKFATNPYYRWCEELFADVYSCIVAGPLAAISMQTLLMSIDRDRAWKDDEDHPTPVLRIFIFAEILRILDDNDSRERAQDVPDDLDQGWAEILKIWGYDRMPERSDDRPFRPVRVYAHDRSVMHLETIVNVTRVMNAIQPIIKEFATRLLTAYASHSAQSQDALATNIPWTHYDGRDAGLYNVVMHRMVNLNFAREQLPRQAILNAHIDETLSDLSNPDEKLRQYSSHWDDRGPHMTGGH